MWGYSSLRAQPQKCGVGLRRWKNQHMLSSFCIIISTRQVKNLCGTVLAGVKVSSVPTFGFFSSGVDMACPFRSYSRLVTVKRDVS